MSDHQNEVPETPEATVVRLQALLKAEHERVATLQAELQHMRVHQVQMVRLPLVGCIALCKSSQIPLSLPTPFSLFL